MGVGTAVDVVGVSSMSALDLRTQLAEDIAWVVGRLGFAKLVAWFEQRG